MLSATTSSSAQNHCILMNISVSKTSHQLFCRIGPILTLCIKLSRIIRMSNLCSSWSVSKRFARILITLSLSKLNRILLTTFLTRRKNNQDSKWFWILHLAMRYNAKISWQEKITTHSYFFINQIFKVSNKK